MIDGGGGRGPAGAAGRSDELFERGRLAIARRVDRLFAGLMAFQWVAGIAAALVVSPWAWDGASGRVHAHVWAATLLGGAIAIVPVALATARPGAASTRYAIAVGQMLMGSLLIHLGGGRIETHFHIFGSLAFLALYRDWRALVAASAVAGLDHALRGAFWPRSIYGALSAGPWRWAEHVGWVVFEDVVLVGSCLRGARELREVADRQAQLEATREGIEATVRDRTEELRRTTEQLRGGEARTRAILRAAADGIVTFDERGVVESLNDAAEAIFGLAPGEMVGREAARLIPPGPGGEVEGRRPDGSRFPMDLAVAEALVGDRRLTVAIVRDITGRKRAEGQRARLLADLQSQSADLEAAREEAERSSRVKSEFLANMSHELRTPMNSIMGFTQRLIRKLGRSIGERELDALRTVDRNAKHLLGLINSILDLSKIEAGRMELQVARLDLVAAVREVAEQAAPLADGKPVGVILDLPDGPIPLDGDRVALKQVALNLLSNAIKYTDRGTVTVTVREVPDGRLGRSARVAFRDTGVGIRPEDRGRLFRQFTQLDGSPTRKVGGTGLGLVITDQFVRMHGGRIDVESEYGRGSEFAVVLPLGPRPAPAGPAPTPEPAPSPSPGPIPAPPPPAAGGVTILCVDDEPDILKYLQLTFQDVGYDVLLAGDHDGALRGARGRRPDLICLDLTMPGRDGFDVMRSLRDDPGLAGVPVLVVSAGGEEKRALGAGARSYLAKPVDADGLMATVRGLLGAEVGGALIVEDDPDASGLLASTLAEHGLAVRTAADGREGLRRLAEATPSVIILDLMMPGMDGFAFLERLRLDPAGSRVPVVVLSAKALDPAELAGLRAAGATVLAKGGDDARAVVDAVLGSALPGRRAPRGVAS